MIVRRSSGKLIQLPQSESIHYSRLFLRNEIFQNCFCFSFALPPSDVSEHAAQNKTKSKRKRGTKILPLRLSINLFLQRTGMRTSERTTECESEGWIYYYFIIISVSVSWFPMDTISKRSKLRFVFLSERWKMFSHQSVHTHGVNILRK